MMLFIFLILEYSVQQTLFYHIAPLHQPFQRQGFVSLSLQLSRTQSSIYTHVSLSHPSTMQKYQRLHGKHAIACCSLFSCSILPVGGDIGNQIGKPVIECLPQSVLSRDLVQAMVKRLGHTEYIMYVLNNRKTLVVNVNVSKSITRWSFHDIGSRREMPRLSRYG